MKDSIQKRQTFEQSLRQIEEIGNQITEQQALLVSAGLHHRERRVNDLTEDLTNVRQSVRYQQ